MDDRDVPFHDWLRALAIQAGYDLNGRGGLTDFSRAAGTDRGQTSRAIRGEVRPSIDNQRAWARVLGVPLTEMLVRSGTLNSDDLPESGSTPPPRVREIDLFAVAAKFGIPPERAHLFVKSVEAVANTFADDDKPLQ
ncbi:helix-turn-helix domain-containing protein [Kitasatospora sp. NPDC059408]|uniref:helix-turn-helix domain-containing protein n=1 Tax=Kitasatospora sp. NPDC059408 TaxID=3346823 RepID=UPI0036BEC40E